MQLFEKRFAWKAPDYLIESYQLEEIAKRGIDAIKRTIPYRSTGLIVASAMLVLGAQNGCTTFAATFKFKLP